MNNISNPIDAQLVDMLMRLRFLLTRDGADIVIHEAIEKLEEQIKKKRDENEHNHCRIT